ncbi:hypothetical protein OJAG_16510 [Oerskovia enterophila]|uniref:Uncharacterized protein n=1 Tax=Oerskovia enterophila TaxID=43678 RepID=A0A161YHR6_9CELL|nr:hypothetical protein OJAG_16510 [Oerskovia enterophila]
MRLSSPGGQAQRAAAREDDGGAGPQRVLRARPSETAGRQALQFSVVHFSTLSAAVWKSVDWSESESSVAFSM